MTRYRRQSVAVADSAFAVAFTPTTPVEAILRKWAATIALATQAAHGAIRVTTDGSEPTILLPRYDQPLTVPSGTTLRACSFAADDTPLSATRVIDVGIAAFLTRDSAALSSCPGGGHPPAPAAGRRCDRPAFDLNIFDMCWIYPQAPVTQVDRIDVRLGRLARNFALREAQRRLVRWRYNATRYGMVSVHVGMCDGPAVASMAIPGLATSANRVQLTSAITLPPGTTGARDLCFTTSPPGGGPIYAIKRVTLRPTSG